MCFRSEIYIRYTPCCHGIRGHMCMCIQRLPPPTSFSSMRFLESAYSWTCFKEIPWNKEKTVLSSKVQFYWLQSIEWKHPSYNFFMTFCWFVGVPFLSFSHCVIGTNQGSDTEWDWAVWHPIGQIKQFPHCWDKLSSNSVLGMGSDCSTVR